MSGRVGYAKARRNTIHEAESLSKWEAAAQLQQAYGQWRHRVQRCEGDATLARDTIGA